MVSAHNVPGDGPTEQRQIADDERPEAPSFERCVHAFARLMDLSVGQLTALLESYDLRLVPRSVSDFRARPRGVCFPAEDLGDSSVSQTGSVSDGT